MSDGRTHLQTSYEVARAALSSTFMNPSQDMYKRDPYNKAVASVGRTTSDLQVDSFRGGMLIDRPHNQVHNFTSGISRNIRMLRSHKIISR